MKWLPGAFALLWPAIIPPMHIAVLYYFWSRYTRVVDRDSCRNSCWDTVYKGLLSFYYLSLHRI